MKKRFRWIFWSLILLLLVTLTIAEVLTSQRPTNYQALSSESSAPDGAQALYQWLSAIGFRVSNETSAVYSIPPQTEAVLILQPALHYSLSGSDWTKLDEWVRLGGFLILADEMLPYTLASGPIPEINAQWIQAEEDSTLYPPAPLFRAPPLLGGVRSSPHYDLLLKNTDAHPLLSTQGHVAAADITHGKGHILLFSDPTLFTNAGLKNEGNARLVLNLVSLLPDDSHIWFDEWHHGQIPVEESPTFTHMAAGQALFLAGGILFLALVLNGRRFGLAIPITGRLERRSSIEYINALASLKRRAGSRRDLMHEYRSQLKQVICRCYPLEPHLPDDEFARASAAYNPHIDATRLASLLKNLDRASFTEGEIVQLAREAVKHIQDVQKS